MRIRKRVRGLTALLALTFVLMLALPATAGYPFVWKLIGERAITNGDNHVLVPVADGSGAFLKVQVQVLEHGVRLRQLTIDFNHGVDQSVPVQQTIPADGATDELRVPGGKRVLRNIDVGYGPQSLGGQRAVVRVLGLQ
jgi:hypothetical protein